MKKLRFVMAKKRPEFLDDMTLYLINENGFGSIIFNASADTPPMEIKNANWFGIRDRPNFVAAANSLEELKASMGLPDPEEPKVAISAESLEFLDYESRELLRATEQEGLIFVDKLGGFRWSEGFIGFDDDQTCFNTPEGQWMLEYPSIEQAQELVKKDPTIVSQTVTWSSTVPFTADFPEANFGDLVTTSTTNILEARVSEHGKVRIVPAISSGTALISVYKV